MSNPRTATPHAPPTLDRHLTYRLHMLNKLSDKISQDKYLQLCQLSLGEARCLAAVGSFPQITVNALAFEANLDKGPASRAAQSLADLGLLTKTVSESDGRSVILSLTEAGKQRWSEVMALIDQRNQEIFGCLSHAERLLLGEMLDRLIANVKAIHKSAPSAPPAEKPPA